ncbi:hypothetical protein [Microbacterium tumbae]
MSTSDSQGKEPLTRKQMRELRLTGSTPVISEEEAASSPAQASTPTRAVEPMPVAPAPVADADVDLESAPLTRRQAREQERIRTASVPVIAAEERTGEDGGLASSEAAAVTEAPEVEEDAPAADEQPQRAELVSEIPAFAPIPASTETHAAAEEPVADETSADETDAEAVPAEEQAASTEPGADDAADLTALGVDAEAIEDLDDEDEPDDADERPTVSSAFGSGVLSAEAPAPAFTPSFDDLITVGDTTGSQSIAPSALIFTPPPGEGSLSGPVASTGEVLITGTYELPEGIGSQGHAKGVADGKDVDAVLIDGELPPASSPTPIAASSAISTSKPAGEIIRPPAPEKGNRLMLILAITAGGLALVLAAALVFAFTTNVLG